MQDKKGGDFAEESLCSPSTFWHVYQIDDIDLSEGGYNSNP